MSYLVIGILLVLIVGGFITFLVLNATRRSNPAGADESGAPGMGVDEDTPLGDTPEHAGRQDGGRTVSGSDDAGDDAGAGGRFKRDPVGGEAEAAPFSEQDVPRR